MLKKWLQKAVALLLCAGLLCTPAAAEGEQMGEEAREQAYLIELQQQRLLSRYRAGKLTLEDYFARKQPLDAQKDPLGSPFAEEAEINQLPAHYRTLYNDVQYQKRMNSERMAELEGIRHGRGLANAAYYSRRFSLERQARELEQEEQRILWESRENPQGQSSDTGDLYWAARYRAYRNEQEQQLLETLYRAGKIDKQLFTERREELHTEEQQAAAALKEADRAAEKYQLRTVIPEEKLNDYLEVEKRLAQIEKELQKLEERLCEEGLSSGEYLERKRELTSEQRLLQEKRHADYRGYEK